MIHGVGTDIVAIARIERMLSEHGARTAAKLLADSEMEGYRQAARPAAFLAKRFAAKEALGKALGLGLREPATLHNIAMLQRWPRPAWLRIRAAACRLDAGAPSARPPQPERRGRHRRGLRRGGNRGPAMTVSLPLGPLMLDLEGPRLTNEANAKSCAIRWSAASSCSSAISSLSPSCGN
jgi:holo-[acyl-carrier-protein] synthase